MLVHTIVCEKDSKGWQVDFEDDEQVDLTCSTCGEEGVSRETYTAIPIPHSYP